MTPTSFSMNYHHDGRQQRHSSSSTTSTTATDQIRSNYNQDEKPVINNDGPKRHGSFWTNAINSTITSENLSNRQQRNPSNEISDVRKPTLSGCSRISPTKSSSSVVSSLEISQFARKSSSNISRSPPKKDNTCIHNLPVSEGDYSYPNKKSSVPITPKQKKKKREGNSSRKHRSTTTAINRPVMSPHVKKCVDHVTTAEQIPRGGSALKDRRRKVTTPTKVITPKKTTISPVAAQARPIVSAATPSTVERVAVLFNERNTKDCVTMVQSLSCSGSDVLVVMVRSFSHEITQMLRMKRVTFKVLNQYSNIQDLAKVLKGTHRAILVTKFWEHFEDLEEEMEALTLISACHEAHVSQVLFSTAEDTQCLREAGLTSQLALATHPGKSISGNGDCDGGTLQPTFAGMKRVRKEAKTHNVLLTHMITSYLDYENSGASLCVISGPTGKLIITPCSIDNGEVAKALEQRECTSKSRKGQIFDAPPTVMHNTPNMLRHNFSPNSIASSPSIPSPLTQYDGKGHPKSPMSHQSATPGGEVQPINSPGVVAVRQLANDFDSACSPTKNEQYCEINEGKSTRAAAAQNDGSPSNGKPMPFVSYAKPSSISGHVGRHQIETKGKPLAQRKADKNAVAADKKSCTGIVASILSVIGCCITWFLRQIFFQIPIKIFSFILKLIFASFIISIGWLYFVESYPPQSVCMGYYGCNPQGVY